MSTFVTDSRIYESPSERGDDFICVFGDLRGPVNPATFVIEFDAELTRPDGTVSQATYAHLDYPVHPDDGEEIEHMVLMWGVKAQGPSANSHHVTREANSLDARSSA